MRSGSAIILAASAFGFSKADSHASYLCAFQARRFASVMSCSAPTVMAQCKCERKFMSTTALKRFHPPSQRNSTSARGEGSLKKGSNLVTFRVLHSNVPKGFFAGQSQCGLLSSMPKKRMVCGVSLPDHKGHIAWVLCLAGASDAQSTAG